MSETNWSDVGVSELLPSGTVTLLLADVEGSTRLWENDSNAMTAAVALAGDNHLARIPSVARNIQSGAGISWQRTQPGSLSLQQRPRGLRDRDLLLAREATTPSAPHAPGAPDRLR